MGSIIKVNEYKDFNNNDIMTSDGAGVITPNATGIKNTPAFSARQSSSQSISNNTDTKMTSISSEDFDTDNNFASDKFTPTTSGKYLIIINCIYASGTDAQYAGVQLRKNGSTVESAYIVAQDYNRAILTTIQEANGSTDYFEVYALQQSGGSINMQVAEFSGYKLIGV
jgi:hypothetical protein